MAIMNCALLGLPHACGGVSPSHSIEKRHWWSSPRMWGCFRSHSMGASRLAVFPTHVGVFLTITPEELARIRLPHACGGVSDRIFADAQSYASSPRMWGCFWPERADGVRRVVFPTHVGVFLYYIVLLFLYCSLPHACGGVSNSYIHLGVYYQSSPRMWGQFSSRTTYQRRAFHALGHIQQELRDGQAPRTPDLEKPFQTIPPPGILLGGHAGSPARGRHGFKPCPFRRSGRG